MNILELREILNRNHIPDRLYRLPGMVSNDDCFSLEPVSGKWTSSYWERGMPYSEKTFATEEEGCAYLWQQIKESVKWPISLDAPPLTTAMTAFREYFPHHSEIFLNRGFALWYQGFGYAQGNVETPLKTPYLFQFTNWNRRLTFDLTFTDLHSTDLHSTDRHSTDRQNQGDGLSLVLSDFSRQRISIKDLLATRGLPSDAALFDYPQNGQPCEDHLPHFKAALERALEGILKPVLEGAPLTSLSLN